MTPPHRPFPSPAAPDRVRPAVVAALVVAAVLAPLVGLGRPAWAADAREAATGVEAAVRGYAAEFAVPGMVAVVLDPDGTVTTVPHGRTSDGAPVTADTRFRIASMSKAFTAVAVLQLAEQGRLRLDQPVAELLPGFAVADPRGASITVRHLLSHTSGLAAADVDEFALPPATSSAALVEGLRDVPLARDPGTAHDYLNANYVVAARIVETLTGRPFGEHLREAVLLPLGMTATLATDRCDAPVPGLPLGHVGALGVQVPVPEIPAFCAGDGGVVTTAADLTHWLRFQTGDGAPLLAAASLWESHTAAAGTDGRYGLGWSVRTSDDGGTRMLHGGALTTWTSGIELSPTGSGAFVLTDAAGAPGLLAARLVAQADGVEPGPPPTDPMRLANLALLGLVALAVVLLTVAVLRAGRRSRVLDGRRRAFSLPAVAVVTGALLLPVVWAVGAGPSWTGWLMLLWMLPLAGVLALVLVVGGAAALVARSRLRRRLDLPPRVTA